MEKPKIIQPPSPETVKAAKEFQRGALKREGREGEITDVEFDDLNNKKLHEQAKIFKKNPKLALKYYKRKKEESLNNLEGTHGSESLIEFQYFNAKILDTVIKNPKLKNRADSESSKLGEKFEEFFTKRLFTILRSDHYPLIPGTSIVTSQSFESQFCGYSFEMSITESQEEGDVIECSFDLSDRNGDHVFIGRMIIDRANENVNIELLPSTNSTNRKDLDFTSSHAEKVKSLMGVTYLMRRPEMANTFYRNGRRPDDGLEATGPMLHDVGKELKETMASFRRRTVDNVDDAWDQVSHLVNSIDDELRSMLRAGVGGLNLNVHYISYAQGGARGRWSSAFNAELENAGAIGMCIENNREGLERLVLNALSRGDKAVISLDRCWVPPELDGSARGKSPRPHIRKRHRSVLVLGRKFNGDFVEIRDMFSRRSNGENLSREEEVRLNNFFREYDIDNPFDISFEQVDEEGVHFADGSYNVNKHNADMGGNYVIRP